MEKEGASQGSTSTARKRPGSTMKLTSFFAKVPKATELHVTHARALERSVSREARTLPITKTFLGPLAYMDVDELGRIEVYRVIDRGDSAFPASSILGRTSSSMPSRYLRRTYCLPNCLTTHSGILASSVLKVKLRDVQESTDATTEHVAVPVEDTNYHQSPAGGRHRWCINFEQLHLEAALQARTIRRGKPYTVDTVDRRPGNERVYYRSAQRRNWLQRRQAQLEATVPAGDSRVVVVALAGISNSGRQPMSPACAQAAECARSF
ncbi:hypothetical protein HPB50_028179 [Hyalomma asiaticum]|nr:hypothetical protein HPB50_028179 [Hyalomma asiaticum]